MFIWESHIEMPSYLQDRLIKSFDHHSRFWNTSNDLFVSQSDDKYIAPITTYNNLSHFTKVEGLMDFYSNIIEKMMKEIGIQVNRFFFKLKQLTNYILLFRLKKLIYQPTYLVVS